MRNGGVEHSLDNGITAYSGSVDAPLSLRLFLLV
jgi:hypothetical protein